MAYLNFNRPAREKSGQKVPPGQRRLLIRICRWSRNPELLQERVRCSAAQSNIGLRGSGLAAATPPVKRIPWKVQKRRSFTFGIAVAIHGNEHGVVRGVSKRHSGSRT